MKKRKNNRLPVVLLAVLLVALLTSCSVQRVSASQDVGESGSATVQAEVTTELDRNKVTLACVAEVRAAEGDGLQEVQTGGFTVTDQAAGYAFVPQEDPAVTRQDDGTYLVKQTLQVYKSNAREEIAQMALEATFAWDPDSRAVTGAAAVADVQD